MDIKLLWIQFLTYIAAAVAGLLGGVFGHTITTQFPDMPAQLATAFTIVAAAGPGYFIHHYLDGLLNQHKIVIADQQATIQSQQATITDLQSKIAPPLQTLDPVLTATASDNTTPAPATA